MIREMTLADVEAIAELEEKIFSSPWPAREFRYELTENPYSCCLVLEEDGKIVAYCDYWIIFDRAELANIAVVKEYRRRGYAQELLDRVIHDAEEQHCEYLTLEVRVSNEPAIRFYEKNGFIKANIRENYYTDNNEDAWLMVRPLNITGGDPDDNDPGN